MWNIKISAWDQYHRPVKQLEYVAQSGGIDNCLASYQRTYPNAVSFVIVVETSQRKAA